MTVRQRQTHPMSYYMDMVKDMDNSQKLQLIAILAESVKLETRNTAETKRNPKRMQRDVKKQMQENGIGTKSQQALKMQQEHNKQERKVRSRERKEADEQRMFELKQQKKREKHKGH